MSEEIIGRRFQLSSFQIIILGFAGVILLGALLLMLPISTTERCVTPFNEALFTATSAVCVTGLVLHDTGSYWSSFGQTIILTLIQIGGLGVVTVVLWSDNYSDADTDWWPWCCHCCGIICPFVQTKNFFDAAQHHAGRDISSKCGWYRPAYEVYPVGDIFD